MTDSSQQIKRRPKLYMSFGVLRGQYQPSQDVFSKGVLVTEDGVQFPAIVQPKLEQQIQQQPELLNTQQIFGVWPCTSAESLKLFMKLKGVRKEDSQQPGYPTAEVDKFSICGVVVSQDQEAGKLVIQIKRNGKIPPGKELDPALQPFNLEISGELPDKAVGQFWELTCARQGEQIVITEANLLVESPPAIKKPQACAIKAPAKSSTVAPAPGDKETFEVTPSTVNAGISLTPGKMEVVVKLNQFPNDVRTVDKGWKEFEVDTGDALVTITVKPKVFATLEQAKLDYSDWVAAISGQMGEVTLTGFRLESPSIKVFERKAKSPQEQDRPIWISCCRKTHVTLVFSPTLNYSHTHLSL